MNAPLPPSLPGYDFRTADLGNAAISPEAAARIVMQLTGGQGGNAVGDLEGADQIAALLASLLKVTKRGNAFFQPFPFSYTDYQQQQVLTFNPYRQYLLVQNVGGSDVMLVLEESPTTVQDYSGEPTPLVQKQTRAVRIVAGGYYEPLTVPTNAITLFTLNGDTNGLVIEGR